MIFTGKHAKAWTPYNSSQRILYFVPRSVFNWVTFKFVDTEMKLDVFSSTRRWLLWKVIKEKMGMVIQLRNRKNYFVINFGFYKKKRVCNNDFHRQAR